ncbi:uncharacterized protein J4E79_004329 [Alternaria viburni]|uniref:uncharacterized protein n=1 Tax=Alternaria viburni TaxID=566460 RepID=UPI0020C46C1E|nr:uncharacterized protein J4E79_004329 [Alternaria viburni]KAI4663017.1 hypothetical protein J4E79_004329 [Alternaria viburni]
MDASVNNGHPPKPQQALRYIRSSPYLSWASLRIHFHPPTLRSRDISTFATLLRILLAFNFIQSRPYLLARLPMSSSRNVNPWEPRTAGVMTSAAAESLVPLQKDFIKRFVDRLDKPPIFHSETTLSIAALRYFTKPLFEDTHAEISKVADSDLTTAMGRFVGNCVKNMLSTGAISCSGRRSGGITEEPAAGGTMVPSVMRPTAAVPDDNSRPTKRLRPDHTIEEKLGTPTVPVAHGLRAPHVRVYVNEDETRMVDASTQSTPATQDEEMSPLAPSYDSLQDSCTDKMELLELGLSFVRDYTEHASEHDLTLSDHVGTFLDCGMIDAWDLDEDWIDDNRERLMRVINALYS